MSQQPFLPLFFGDLLAATPTWEGEERALYILLLAYQWTSGPLPADPKRLAKMTQYDAKTFATLWQTVGPKFDQTPDGLVNKRLEQHRERSKQISNERSRAGKRGAEAKATANAQAKPVAIADGLPKQTPSIHPIPSHPILPEEPSTHLETEEGARRDALAGQNGTPKPEGLMAIALRDKGVAVTSQDPTLLAWIRDGFTPDQAVEAVGIARIRKPWPERIPAKYLDAILRTPQAPAPQKLKPRLAIRTADEIEADERARETANAAH